MKGLTALTALLLGILITGCNGANGCKTLSDEKEYYFDENTQLLDSIHRKFKAFADSSQFYQTQKDKAKSDRFLDSAQKYTYIYGFIDEHTRASK